MCGSKGTATSSSSYSLPPEVAKNYSELAAQAKQTAAIPFSQYNGEMVAGLTPTQQAGIQNVNASAQEAQPYYQAATGLVGQAANPFGQQQLNQYMSPYINSVANSTLANLNETNAQQQQQLLGNTISKGAFGGDRGGIAQAELARQQNLAQGQTMANIYQGGFNQAQTQFNADQARALQAGSTFGQLGTGAQTAGLQGAQGQMAAGATQQAVQQAQDTANQQQFQARQAYPFQTTQYLANLLLGIGGQSGGTALTSQPQGNIGSSLVGGLLTAGSLFAPSDERLKENMEPVGKTFDGQNIYKYNFKGDPQTNIGLSAQEVEKHHPSAVRKNEDGIRMVNYDQATGVAANKGHFAKGGVADSMGGGVHASSAREGFALSGGVDSQYGVDIPYSEQPTGGSGKPLTLADVMTIKHLGRSSPGWTTKPAARPVDESGGIDPNAVLKQAMANPTEKANLQGWANTLIGRSPGTVNASDVIGNSQGTYSLGLHYADGGVVGRHGYAEDGFVPPPNQYAAKLGSLGDTIGEQYKNLSAPPDPNRPRTIAESIVGHPLSDEANMGLLSAGLAMMGSKSPIFGIGVAEGAQTGLGTYYNALKNKRDFQSKLLEDQERAYGSASTGAYQQGELGLRGEQLKQEQFKTAFSLNNELRKEWVPQFPKDGGGFKNALTGQTINEDQYYKLFEDNAALLRLPKGLSSIIRTGATVPAQAKGGRVGLALGGVESAALPEEGQVSNAIKDKENMSKLISTTLGAGEGDIDRSQPKVQVADALSDIAKNAKPNPMFPDIAPTGTPDYYNEVADYYQNKNEWLSTFGSSREKEAIAAFENANKFRSLAKDIANGEAPTQLIDPNTGKPAGFAKSPSAVTAAQKRAAEAAGMTKTSENQANEIKDFNEETKKALPAFDRDEQLLDTLTNIYQNVSSNNLSGIRAQLIGYMQSLGISKLGGLDLEQIQSADAIGVKAATSEAIETVAAELQRSPAVGLKTSLKTVASPDLPATSRYQLIQSAYADLMQERDLRTDWLDAGKPDPTSFRAKWLREKDADGNLIHDLPSYRQRAVDTKMTKMFPGMTPESIKNLLNKPTNLWSNETGQGSPSASQKPTLRLNPNTNQFEPIQ